MTAVTKTGAGTFVDRRHAARQLASVGVNPWTMDIGKFDINAGEVQLTHTGLPTQNFGIKGDLNNAGQPGSRPAGAERQFGLRQPR